MVFPEIEGIAAFDEVAATLDVIERLEPRLVVPGHGGLFGDVQAALGIARKRLAGFVQAPQRHASYAAKVLLKYKLLEWQSINVQDLQRWVHATPYFGILHQSYFGGQTEQQWLDGLVAGLVASGAAELRRDATGAPVLLNQ